MRNVMDKVCKEIDCMNSTSKRVIKYGSWAFILLLLISLGMSVLNRHWLGNIYEVTNNSILLFKTSFSVLAIIVVGGLVIDYISKKG